MRFIQISYIFLDERYECAHECVQGRQKAKYLEVTEQCTCMGQMNLYECCSQDKCGESRRILNPKPQIQKTQIHTPKSFVSPEIANDLNMNFEYL